MPLTQDDIKKIAKEICKDMELKRWIKEQRDAEEEAKRKKLEAKEDAKRKELAAKEELENRENYFRWFSVSSLIGELLDTDEGRDYDDTDDIKYNKETYEKVKKFVEEVVKPFVNLHQ